MCCPLTEHFPVLILAFLANVNIHVSHSVSRSLILSSMQQFKYKFVPRIGAKFMATYLTPEEIKNLPDPLDEAVMDTCRIQALALNRPNLLSN